MKPEPVLTRITIYPVKSLDGISLEKAMITEGGCLLHDREYALSDKHGNFIIGKTNPLVHSLRSTIDFEKDIISFRHQHETTWNQFHLQQEKSSIESYLAGYFGMPTLLHQNKNGRFMDMPDVSGITVVSTASLASVSEWFNNMNMDVTRKRFRATVEIDAVPAFWEDHLFSKEKEGIEFKIGDVTMFGTGPGQGVWFQRVTRALVKFSMPLPKHLPGSAQQVNPNGQPSMNTDIIITSQ